MFSALTSCWQLMTSKVKKNLLEIFVCTLQCISVPNFSSLAQILFSLTVISCYQLLTEILRADNTWQKNYQNFHVDIKVDTYATFQLSRLIFIFVNCYRLSSAVGRTAADSWYENNLIEIFMYTLQLVLLPNFSSLGPFSFLSVFTAVISC